MTLILAKLQAEGSMCFIIIRLEMPVKIAFLKTFRQKIQAKGLLIQ